MCVGAPNIFFFIFVFVTPVFYVQCLAFTIIIAVLIPMYQGNDQQMTARERAALRQMLLDAGCIHRLKHTQGTDTQSFIRLSINYLCIHVSVTPVSLA